MTRIARVVAAAVGRLRGFFGGRPLGDESFVSHLEHLLGRELQPGKLGRKSKKSEKSRGRTLDYKLKFERINDRRELCQGNQ
jgi:hypothetical protein